MNSKITLEIMDIFIEEAKEYFKESGEKYLTLENLEARKQVLVEENKRIADDKMANNKCYYKHPEYGYIRVNHEDGNYSEICCSKITGRWSEYCRCIQ